WTATGRHAWLRGVRFRFRWRILRRKDHALPIFAGIDAFHGGYRDQHGHGGAAEACVEADLPVAEGQIVDRAGGDAEHDLAIADITPGYLGSRRLGIQDQVWRAVAIDEPCV